MRGEPAIFMSIRNVTVFDKNTVARNQAVVIIRKVAAKLSLERRFSFIMAFYSGYAG